MLIKYCLLAILNFSFLTTCFSNQQVKEMRENWHRYLPMVARDFPITSPVRTYSLAPNIQVYEPEECQRVMIWVPGNAFLFEEPTSHVSFFNYLGNKTRSKIIALSHRKIPEFTYADMQQDLRESISLLKNLLGDIPVTLCGDSSGAMLVMGLLPDWQRDLSIEQLLFVAPIFNMKDLLNNLEAFPENVQPEIANQHGLMQFIASLLYQGGVRIVQPEVKQLPKTHIICFEYDVFYEQALRFKEKFPSVSLDTKWGRYHVDYLLKTIDENHTDVVAELFSGLP